MQPTDLTVAAIVRKGEMYLLVEEYAMGQEVINQPGGHIEAGESPEAAVIREVLDEESAVFVLPDDVNAWHAALKRLLKDKALCEKLAENAYALAGEYTWQARQKKILC